MRTSTKLSLFIVYILPALLTTSRALADDTESSERAFRIDAMAPEMHELVSPDAELELLGDRYGLTEGPLWMDDGNDGFLLFTDLISNAIFKWTPAEGTSVFLDDAGYSGNDINNAGFQAMRGRMRVILIGPNGLTLDPQGRAAWCAMRSWAARSATLTWLSRAPRPRAWPPRWPGNTAATPHRTKLSARPRTRRRQG